MPEARPRCHGGNPDWPRAPGRRSEGMRYRDRTVACTSPRSMLVKGPVITCDQNELRVGFVS